MTSNEKTYIFYIAYSDRQLRKFVSKQFFKDKKAIISIERWYSTIETDKFKILAVSLKDSLLGYISCQRFDYACDDSKPDEELTEIRKNFYDGRLLESKSKYSEYTKEISVKNFYELIKNL